MNCPYCNAVNDDENSFCVSCGETISQNMQTQPDVMPPTQIFQPNQANEPQSVQTAYPPPSYPNQMPPNYQTPKKSGKGLIFAALAVVILIILGAIGAGGFYFWQQQQNPNPQTAEILPDHLGMFVQTADKTAVNEIKKTDVVNALEEKEKLLSDESLPVFEENSGLILFSDAKEIPVTDLKLVQLDTIENDGNLKQIDFQAVPIEGKTEMKRLRISTGLARGKYAFALFNGFLNEGNHKFWAFQVKDSKKANNNEIAKSASISVKDSKDKEKSDDKDKSKNSETPAKQDVPPPPKKDTKVPPPSGARVAYCNASNVVLRGSPSLTGKKVGSLSLKQRIYIINYSSNYDEWRGTTANWAYIQTESGARGWVFTPFVYY